jgi:predicted dehydrogenase
VSVEPLRLGIVGCGAISERHGPAAALTPAVSIVACCDVRRDVAEQWRERFGCERAYDDYLSMVREHELDGVILATWPNLHREQVLGCLDAGVRCILCEKSLALTGAEALEIWQAAEERDALVVEGYMYRHHPAFQSLLELVESGRTGSVDSVWAAFSLFDPADAPPDIPLWIGVGGATARAGSPGTSLAIVSTQRTSWRPRRPSGRSRSQVRATSTGRSTASTPLSSTRTASSR